MTGKALILKSELSERSIEWRTSSVSDCGIRSSVHTQRNITHEQVSAKHRSPETHQRCASLILPSSYEANGANNHLSFSTVVINRTPIITQLNYNLLLPVSYISITAPNTFKHVSTAFEGKGTSSLSLCVHFITAFFLIFHDSSLIISF